MNIKNNKNCNISINGKKIEEKSAREMFEELGLYEQKIDKAFVDTVIMYFNSNCELVITFCLDKQEVAIDSLKENQNKRYELDYKIFKAINKMVEELNWK